MSVIRVVGLVARGEALPMCAPTLPEEVVLLESSLVVEVGEYVEPEQEQKVKAHVRVSVLAQVVEVL